MTIQLEKLNALAYLEWKLKLLDSLQRRRQGLAKLAGKTEVAEMEGGME